MMANHTLTETNGSVTLKPMTSLQLSNLYGISLKTFYKWVVPFKPEIGDKVGRYYNIIQVGIILQKLGFPNSTLKI